jgi:multidrug efflux pump
VIRRLQPELAKVAGITLFMQPVQDLSVEDRVSRTQFQYTLEDANVDELNTLAPKMLARLQQLPELRDVASDQQVLGLRARLVFDRDTAARFGSRLGDRSNIVRRLRATASSTMFTQLNQYHGARSSRIPENPANPNICSFGRAQPAGAAGGHAAGGQIPLSAFPGSRRPRFRFCESPGGFQW